MKVVKKKEINSALLKSQYVSVEVSGQTHVIFICDVDSNKRTIICRGVNGFFDEKISDIPFAHITGDIEVIENLEDFFEIALRFQSKCHSLESAMEEILKISKEARR